MDKPVSMADRAYEMLKRDILRCRFRPGSAILDTYLAAEYGMSRTPIREATNLLRREGLVVVIPKRGTLVKPIDFGELQDTYRMRQLLEPEAAVLASRRANAEELDALAELGEASVSPDADAATLNERNRLLHVRIAELSRIPLLAQTINSLHEEIERFLNFRGAQGRPYTATNHGRIVDIIRTGTEDEIRHVVSSGIERARTHMLEGLMANDNGRAEQAS
ncbi:MULTISPECIES: GntR family transcriptional regulator [unclassified Arthrobacter]|uniref:GntR family transcriptional regulator n=1 Tax=unclassified Arthrobacter TaxID=235627 RepID=UPI0028830F47|nr:MULTISPECIES: GntR family transcriptional regulator [unclassified Arthrobacter]